MSKRQSAKFKEIHEKMNDENTEGMLNRARSITVGTCFGGTTEIIMRAANGSVLYAPMQPVEIIEFIHQLAANVGCHIHIQPRKDFSSWRDWKVTEEEKLHYNGWPPFVNDMGPHQSRGQILPSPKEQPGLKEGHLPPPEQQPGLKTTERNLNESLATKEIVN